MEEILEKQYADFISMSRLFIREPLLVKNFKLELAKHDIWHLEEKGVITGTEALKLCEGIDKFISKLSDLLEDF